MDAASFSPAGYNAEFLQILLQLPVPPAENLIRELPCTHFTVLLDPARRLAIATGVNIDGDQLVDVDRGDNWHLDPRIPAHEQAGEGVYARNDLDSGHLVRRQGPVWGNKTIARQANYDTFAYTNAAPKPQTLTNRNNSGSASRTTSSPTHAPTLTASASSPLPCSQPRIRHTAA